MSYFIDLQLLFYYTMCVLDMFVIPVSFAPSR